MNCAAEMRVITQRTDWKTGVDFGNITPAKRLETMTGMGGNINRREHTTADMLSQCFVHNVALSNYPSLFALVLLNSFQS